MKNRALEAKSGADAGESSDDHRGHDIERAPRPDFLDARTGLARTLRGVLVAPVLRAFRLLATVQFLGFGQVLPTFMPGGAKQPRLDCGEIAERDPLDFGTDKVLHDGWQIVVEPRLEHGTGETSNDIAVRDNPAGGKTGEGGDHR